MNAVEIALHRMEQSEGLPAGSLWIAPDVSGNAAIWRERGPGELLHCVGHVAGALFTGLLSQAVIRRFQADGSDDD